MSQSKTRQRTGKHGDTCELDNNRFSFEQKRDAAEQKCDSSRIFSSKSGPGFKPGTFQHFVFLSEALTAQFSHDVAYLINFQVVTPGIFLIYYIAWP